MINNQQSSFEKLGEALGYFKKMIHFVTGKRIVVSELSVVLQYVTHSPRSKGRDENGLAAYDFKILNVLEQKYSQTKYKIAL